VGSDFRPLCAFRAYFCIPFEKQEHAENPSLS
jgi:hypothetical protein